MGGTKRRPDNDIQGQNIRPCKACRTTFISRLGCESGFQYNDEFSLPDAGVSSESETVKPMIKLHHVRRDGDRCVGRVISIPEKEYVVNSPLQSSVLQHRIAHQSNSSNTCSTTVDFQSLSRKNPFSSSKEIRASRFWQRHIDLLNRTQPDFFSTNDAKLSQNSTTWKESLKYDGLGATKDNCLALAKLYELLFYPKERMGFPDADGFRRLSNTVSQYLRLCVSRGLCHTREAYKTTVLFRSSTNLDIVQRFISFHIECFSPRTILRKAQHMRMVCTVAEAFVGTIQERESIRRVSEYLEVITKTNRNYMLKSTFAQKQLKSACPSNSIRLWFQLAFDDLRHMMADFIAGNVDHEHDFLKRWQSAFVTFVVISSGGQNLQTIASIEIPSGKDFEELSRKATRVGFVQLSTLRGKRNQALDLPAVVLPSFCINILRFHVKVVQPVIISSTEKRNSTGCLRSLMVDMNTGNVMPSWKISYLFRRYVAKQSPDAPSTSVSSLKETAMRAFARGYREKKLLRDQSESQFHIALGRYMNTSPLQVRKQLGVRGSAEHESTCKELARILARI